jgi:hypothetical protein
MAVSLSKIQMDGRLNSDQKMTVAGLQMENKIHIMQTAKWNGRLLSMTNRM